MQSLRGTTMQMVSALMGVGGGAESNKKEDVGGRRSNQSIAQWVLLVRQPISSSGVRFLRGFNG
jgi:hypothetical protein